MYHLTSPTTIESLETLGDYLRDVREGQRISLDEASAKLHIRAVYLKSLESGDWSDLPGVAYGRGYLRQYAVFLGLIPEDVMEVCDRLQGKVSSRLHYFETESTEQTPSRFSLWFSLAGAAILAALWIFWGDAEIAAPAPNYNLPAELAALLEDRSQVIPSPYSTPAQECMKLMQPSQTPCYWHENAPMAAILASQKTLNLIEIF